MQMVLFQKVLCPVDFDDSALKAVRLGPADRATRRRNGLSAHVVVPTDRFVVSAPTVAQHNEAKARSLLAQVADKELSGVQHETLVRYGSAADETIRASNEIKADLIVIATHARHGLSHLLLGSVAERWCANPRVPSLP
jgi:universal stress protein A